MEEGDEVPLGTLSTSKIGYWHLPIGGVWRLKVFIYDVWGAVSTADDRIEVKPCPDAPMPSYALSLAELQLHVGRCSPRPPA